MHFILGLIAFMLFCQFCGWIIGSLWTAIFGERQPTWIKGVDGEWYRPGDPRIKDPSAKPPREFCEPIQMVSVECNHCGHTLHLTPGRRKQLRGQVFPCPSCGVEKRFRP